MNENRGILLRHGSWFSLLARLLDALVVFGSLPLLCVLYGVEYERAYPVTAVLGGLLTWLLMGAVGAYRSWRGASFWSEAKAVLVGWVMVVISLLVIAWSLKYLHAYSRLLLGSWFLVSPTLILALHSGRRWLLGCLDSRIRQKRGKRKGAHCGELRQNAG